MHTLWSGNTLTLGQCEQKWLQLVMQRTDGVNRFDMKFLTELEHALSIAQNQAGCAGLVLRSNAKLFFVGGDIYEFMARFTLAAPVLDAEIARFQNALNTLEDLPFPTLCLLEGHAFGGGVELAMACQYRVGRPAIRLAMPEVTLGILPGTGGTYRLPRIVGKAWATQMIATGAPINAETALAIGLLDAITEEDLATPEGLFKLANNPALTKQPISPIEVEIPYPQTLAQQLIKQLLSAYAPDLRANLLKLEREYLQVLATSTQARTLIERFVQRQRTDIQH